MKSKSVFFNESFLRTIRNNVKSSDRLQELSKEKIESVGYWMEKDYDQLWDLMFPPTIKRSWMVRSDGQCPDCKKDVHMYNWVIDSKNSPWKLSCPHCKNKFPKNDFYAYYKSGICTDGIFRHEAADTSLLVNEENGSKYGVDDGFSYIDEKGDKYWFIGTYLIYGHWRQLIVDGVVKLTDAFCLTGDIEYARRAAIILDRIADMYPDFDFKEQGIMYEEEKTSRGYISYWANATHDVQNLAVSYDKIFEAIENDNILIDFLNKKAGKHGFSNDKSTVSKIRKNIENNILKDTIDHLHKVITNYPDTEITQICLSLILDDPELKTIALKVLDEIIENGTYVDGIAGEKGGYSASAPNNLITLFLLLDQTDEYSIASLLERYPNIYNTYKFHIDSWVLNKFYPGHGDGGRLSDPAYKHLLSNSLSKGPSEFSKTRPRFAYELYKCTNDTDFVKILYISNGFCTKGLFEDDFTVADSELLQKEIDALIENFGPDLNQHSRDFQRFRIALLKSGKGDYKRAAFIDYDTGGNHSHQDALNIEIYAKGMKFLADFGYPPVNCGGWKGPNFKWYHIPSAHNLVVIDRKEHQLHDEQGKSSFLRYPKYGETTMWFIDEPIKAVYAKAPEYSGTERYERLLALIDISDEDCYFLDIFRTEGGKEHSKFIRNGFSTLTIKGLNLTETNDTYHKDALMRNFKKDSTPSDKWYADFLCDDLYEVLEPGTKLYLRYTPFNNNSSVYTSESKICKSWSVDAEKKCNLENWIPTIIELQTGLNELKSTFVSTYEPHYGNSSFILSERVDVTDTNGNKLSDMNVALKIKMKQGFTDYILAKDPLQTGIIKAFGISTDAQLCFVRIYDNKKEPVIKYTAGTFANPEGLL